MNKEQIYAVLKKTLIENFEIKNDFISPEKLLENDLDLDSLDAVDIFLYLEEYIAGRPDPALFKNAVTVQDLVDTLHPVWKS
jgi:acyl carrier protein